MKLKRTKKWIDLYCKCGCGITVKADDREWERKLEAWEKKHKCAPTAARQPSRGIKKNAVV